VLFNFFLNTVYMAEPRHALTLRSKCQRSRSHGYENLDGHTVASDVCCGGCVLLLHARDCMLIRLVRFFSYDKTCGFPCQVVISNYMWTKLMLLHELLLVSSVLVTELV